MNRREEEKTAKKYNKPGDAYVKADYRSGEDGELIVAGDVPTILRVAERIISRTADLTGQSFVSAWLFVRDLHQGTEGKTKVIQNGVAMPYTGDGEEE